MDQNDPTPANSTHIQQKNLQANTQITSQQRMTSTQQRVTKVKLVSKTWAKDSYGLFDYQAKDDQYDKRQYFVEETTYIVRNHKTCEDELVKDLSELKLLQKETQEDQKSLCPFVQNRADYTVLGELIVDRSRKSPSFKIKLYKGQQDAPKHCDQPLFRNSNYSKRYTPFILADSNGGPKSHGFPLQPGNLIKFGRVEYLVLESFNGKTTESYRDSVYLGEGEDDQIFDVLLERELKSKLTGDNQQVEKENINCKICLCNEETVEDPLISPCNCKGYCGYIHTNCLRQWINNKVKKENLGLTASYNFTKFQCEICKAPFPKIIRTEIDEVEMMKIDKPDKPYIMLESLDPATSGHQSSSNSGEKEKLLHVITTDDKSSIKIGRANECEIRLMDISVSRKHAEIKLVDGEFFIKDTGAKFGTLVQWNKHGNNKTDIIGINRKKTLKIQLGRTSYEFSVEDINQDIDTQ